MRRSTTWVARRTVLVMTALGVLVSCVPGERAGDAAPDPAGLQAAVDTLLDASAAAWNGGRLDGFLLWYRRSPETTYIGSRGLVHGWDEIRARYAPLFEPGAARDSLRFEGLETRPLGPALGLATAHYVLFQRDSVTATGIFTLVVRREREGWRIVHDHSSALPLQP